MRAEKRLAEAGWQGKERLALAGSAVGPEPMPVAPLEVWLEQGWADHRLEALGRLDPEEYRDRSRLFTGAEHTGWGIRSFPKRAALGHFPEVPTSAWGPSSGDPGDWRRRGADNLVVILRSGTSKVFGDPPVELGRGPVARKKPWPYFPH